MNTTIATEAKITTGFNQLTDPDFGNKASGIHLALSGNPIYP